MTDHLEQPALAHFNWWSKAEAQAKRIMEADAPTLHELAQQLDAGYISKAEARRILLHPPYDDTGMDELIAAAEACDAALQALHDAPGTLEDKWGTLYADMLRRDPRTRS